MTRPGVAGELVRESAGNRRSLDDLCRAIAGDWLEFVELAVETDKHRGVVVEPAADEFGAR